MTTNAIATPEQLAIEEVKYLANIVRGLRNEVFKEGLDFGKIPGTGDKPTLLQPGMEKLMRALHLRAEYVEKSRIEDFDNNRIYYRYECRLVSYDTGLCVATAIGSANSYESKWRWRTADRVCPACGKPTIIKGKDEYGGGWVCFAKKGGCGAKYKDNDPAITGQNIGRVENPDIFDQMNTIDKIAQKRALGSAIKGAANVSEIFTVDLEDFVQYDTRPPAADIITVTVEEVTKAPVTPATSQQPTPPPVVQPTPASAPQNGIPDDGAPDPLDWTKDTDGQLSVEDALHPATIGSLDMKKLYDRCGKAGLVQVRKHFDALIRLMKADGSLRDAMSADQAFEAIRQHYAAKETA